MRELNVLQTEGLEEELLGPEWGDDQRGRGVPKGRQPPSEMNVTSFRWRGGGDEEVDPSMDDAGRDRRRRIPYNPAGQSDSRDSSVERRKKGSRGNSVERRQEDQAYPPDDDTPTGSARGIWDAVGDFFKVENIQSEKHVRDLVWEALEMNAFSGKMDKQVRDIFYSLTDTVLKEALQVVKFLQRGPENMMRYGLAMVIVSEYLKLSGLREHVRQDMRTFVDFYERTALRQSPLSNRPDRYLSFNDYYADIADMRSQNHDMSIKMTLRTIGIDISRKMLLAGTHLIELIVALGIFQRAR